MFTSVAMAEPQNHPSSKASTDKKSQYLFVLQAKKAIVVKQNNTYFITFQDIQPQVLYFSERPQRKGGFILTENFMSNWEKSQSSFRDNPPNVAIIHDKLIANTNGTGHALAAELKNPVSAGHHSWKFELIDLEGKVTPGTYDEVSVFIDAGGLMQLVGYGA